MDIYKVVFFGHRDFSEEKKLEKVLYSLLIDLMRTKNYVEFYIGRNGDFDIFAASIIKRAQRNFGNENSSIILVLPYMMKDYEFYGKYYDEIIIPESIGKIHPKAAITKRNNWMVEECNLLICYVKNSFGGAYNAFKIAKKANKKIINLAYIEDDE